MYVEREGAQGVEKQRTQALRAVVDGEDQVAAHGEHGSTGRDAVQTGGGGLRLAAGMQDGLGQPNGPRFTCARHYKSRL